MVLVSQNAQFESHPRDFSADVAWTTRNDGFPDNFNLNTPPDSLPAPFGQGLRRINSATKDLVIGKKDLSIRRTSCHAPQHDTRGKVIQKYVISNP